MCPRGHTMQRKVRAGCGQLAAATALGLAALALVIMSHAGAQPAHQERVDSPPASHGDPAALGAAAAAIQRALASSSAPGVVVGITDRAKTQKVIVWGYADVKARTPLAADSRFAIGSISKSFTSVALMELADEGRFELQAPITRYLPEFSLQSHYRQITGRDVMSHTAGLPNYYEDAASSRYAVVKLREFSPAYAPGAHWWYSNTGYQILGYLIESIERAPYATVIQRRVLDRLGMRSTIPVIDDAHRKAMTVSYEHWPYDGSYVEASWFEYSASDGSIVSDVPDMCAYVRFYLNRGATLLSEKSFDELTKPVLHDYAYGLVVRQENGDTVISHDGSIAGFRAHIEAHMKDGFGIVVLTNGGLDDRIGKWIGQVVTAAYRGQPLPPAPAATVVPDLKDYVGVYRAENASGPGGGALEVIVADGHLALKSAGRNRVLERMGDDAFREAGSGSDNLPLFFFRAGDGKSGKATGKVTDVSRGAEWYVGKEFSGTIARAFPSVYAAYVGHYAHHGPEGPAARVLVRNGALMMAPSGTDGPPGKPEPLVPAGDGFRPGQADVAYNPERVHFDIIEEGRALRLSITGVPLYRMETP
jgi:D-alanyl-D-alanine carboxypeptidase